MVSSAAIRPRFSPRRAAFSMVELMVASAVLSLIMLLTLEITSNINGIWHRTRARIETFQEARAAFESMTRKVSQAMLNPYWDYVDAGGRPRDPAVNTFVPAQYMRQSELHFVTGQARDLLRNAQGSDGKALRSNTHSIFFQAPLGLSEEAAEATPLPSLLNVSGYFVEFGDDAKFRPQFLLNNPRNPLRTRYRLMELGQPSETLAVYNWVNVASRAPVLNPAMLRRWFVDPLNEDAATNPGQIGGRRVRRPIADNVIALIILPKRSEFDGPANTMELAPTYSYDSRAYQLTPGNALARLTRNQLPPLVQITMVAIDETSAARLETRAGPGTPPEFGLSELFGRAENGTQFQQDLATLEQRLNNDPLRINYRVFTTDVSILQAKWSEN